MASSVFKIAVFDSGLGGLSVIEPIRALLPGACFFCLGDHEFFPYGSRPASDISRRLSLLIPAFLRMSQPDILILACNTVSTQALDQVRAETELPVAGVVPAIKPAALLSPGRHIGILATPATVSSPYTRELVRQHARDCRITWQPCRHLARYAEEFILLGHKPGKDLIEAELSHVIASQPDTVALACTHYPLIAPLIREVLPKVQHWTDPGTGVAKQVFRILTGKEPPERRPSAPAPLRLQSPEIRVFSTDSRFEKSHAMINHHIFDRVPVEFFSMP